MPGAQAAVMDAVMFHAKGAHLAAQRVGRRVLRALGMGMTPARFDLMNALGARGKRQSDLWKQLNVVRSVVCEMVRALRAMGWVKRVRAADGRTWLVQRTRRGAELYARANAACVESGDVGVWLDFALTSGYVERDALAERCELVERCIAVISTLHTGPPSPGTDLYVWDPADYYGWFVEPGDIAPEVPFVT